MNARVSTHVPHPELQGKGPVRGELQHLALPLNQSVRARDQFIMGAQVSSDAVPPPSYAPLSPGNLAP